MQPHLVARERSPLFNILMIDLTLAGDNAIVVGMAASRVEKSMRAKVIFWGIAGAVVLRILFSGVAQQMLQVIGLTLAGGLLLLFVSWKMYRQIIEGEQPLDRRGRGQTRLRRLTVRTDAFLAGALDHHSRRRFDVARQRARGRRRGG